MPPLINTILVPVDFSSFSEAAAKTAVSFARHLQANVLLLHVVRIVDYGSSSLFVDSEEDSHQDLAEQVANTTLKHFIQPLDFEGINVTTKICSGQIHSKIKEASEEIGADIIIMGAHGKSGFDNLMGSTTRRMIRFSKVPVLTVHQELRFDNIKTIAFASSFHQEYTFSFPSIYQFMEMFNAELFLIKVITPKDFEPSYYTRKIIEDFAKGFLIKDYNPQIINAVSVEDGLDWFCSEYGIDLLFMTTHGRRGLRRWIKGSYTEVAGQQSSCPVFSIKMMKVEKPKGVIFPQ